MKDFTDRFKKGLQKTTEFLKTASEEAANKIKEGGEALSNSIPTAKEKAIKLVQDVLAVLPLLEEAGHRTNEFQVGIGLSPNLSISFSKFKEVSEEDRNALKELHADKKMFKTILNALETSNSVAKSLDTEDFKSHETIVDIAFPPKVSLRYIHKDFKGDRLNVLD